MIRYKHLVLLGLLSLLFSTPSVAQLRLVSAKPLPSNRVINQTRLVFTSGRESKTVFLDGPLLGIRQLGQPSENPYFLTNRERTLGVIRYRPASNLSLIYLLYLTPKGKIGVIEYFTHELVRLGKRHSKSFNVNYVVVEKIKKRDLSLYSWSNDKNIQCDAVVHMTPRGNLLLKSYRQYRRD